MAHPLKSTRPDHPLILLGIHLLPKQDVAADGSRKHPGLLGRVGQLTFDFERSGVMGQLTQDGAQQGGLSGPRDVFETSKGRVYFSSLQSVATLKIKTEGRPGAEACTNLSCPHWTDYSQELVRFKSDRDILQRRSVQTLEQIRIVNFLGFHRCNDTLRVRIVTLSQ